MDSFKDKKINNSVTEFEQFFNVMPGMFTVLSPELNVVAISSELERALGKPRQHYIGSSVFEAFSDDLPFFPKFTHWKTSLEAVLKLGRSDLMEDLESTSESDVLTKGSFASQSLKSGNFPILGPDGNVQYIIYRAENWNELGELNKVESHKADQVKDEHFLEGDSEMPRLFRETDWSKTALGPTCDWPDNLRTVVEIMLKSEFPMFIAWGKERIFLYNDAYTPILGKKHPNALGMEFETLWNEVWSDVLPLVESVDRGESRYYEDLRLVLHRHGFDEEAYFTFSYSPLRNEANEVVGLYCVCVETTKRVHTERAVKNSLEEVARSERELIDTLESMSDAFLSVDKNWTITRVNKQQEIISRKGREDQLGKNLIDLWFSDSKFADSNYLTSLQKAMNERKGVTFVDYYEPLKIWTEVRISPKDDGGLAVFFTDITERKNAQIEFEKNIDVSPAILWITDEAGYCHYLSKQWYEYTGQTEEEALGFGWLEATHPDDKERVAGIYVEANEQQKPFYVEYRLKTKSGEYRWAIDAGNPRFDKAGNYLGYAGTVFDVHEQKKSAEAIEDLNNRFQRSAQATNLGVWYCDLPFDILNWNLEVKRHFFLPPETEVTIDLFYERIHPEDREATRAAIDASIESRIPYDTVFRTTNPSDPSEVKSIRAVGWTDYDCNGEAIRFDGVTLDVSTDLKRRAELEAAKEEAERANQLKSSFLANMSHEIRTPLGAILGFADLLKENSIGKEESKQFLDTILRNGKALTKIIDDILDLAKVETGKLEVERTEFSFLGLIDDVMDLFRERTRAKGIYLRANLNPTIPDRIVSDPTRLRQILINVIGNAVKFTNEGGVSIEVVVTERADQSFQFNVLVKDTGIGMSEDNKSRIFKPFMQADNTTTRKFGGTGLGLALSKRLANALEGDVRVVDFALMQGCTFEVSFVCRLPSVAPKVTQSEAVVASGDVALAGIKVLVADDSQENLFLVNHILKKHGADVENATNGSEAFRMGIAGFYDVVLMDIQMPEMDGYEATRALRDAGFKKPIIALTAHAMAEERARSFAAGCNGHLTKPLDKAELLKAMESVVAAKNNEQLIRI